MHRVMRPLLYKGFSVCRAKGVFVIFKSGFEEEKIRSQAKWAIQGRCSFCRRTFCLVLFTKVAV